MDHQRHRTSSIATGSLEDMLMEHEKSDDLVTVDNKPTRRDRQISLDQRTLLQSPRVLKESISFDPAKNLVSNIGMEQDPQSDIPANLDEYTSFWKAYNEDADAQDNEIVDSLGGDLDGLLIFAGLFSGSNVSFILEAYKDLRADSADTTNGLLRALLRNQVDPSDPTQEDSTGFQPTPRAIRVNALFFASLSCSLFTAFGAVLGKQWLSHYRREGKRMTLAERGRERQRKYMGLELWHLEQVVETLPTLLHLSLFLFLAALIDFLWPINTTIASIIAGFSVMTFCFYVVTTTIAIYFPSSPFQTRFSAVLRTVGPSFFRLFARFSQMAKSFWASLQSRCRSLWIKLLSIFTRGANHQSPILTTTLRSPDDQNSTPSSRRGCLGDTFKRLMAKIAAHPWFAKFSAVLSPFFTRRILPPAHRGHPDGLGSGTSQDELSRECISWLLATSSVDKTLSLSATAALMLPEPVWKKTEALNRVPYVLRLVLGARAFESKVILDVQPGAVKAVLESIHALVMKWDPRTELVVPTLGDNSSFITAFEHLLWRVVRAYPVEGRTSVWILEILVVLGFTVEPHRHEIDIIYRGVLQSFMHHPSLISVLGSIVLLESSMSFASIIDLLRLSPLQTWDIADILRPLCGSMLLIEKGRFIQIAHPSVRSFFADPSRSLIPNFTHTSTYHHSKLALNCLNHMTKKLRRNVLATDNHLLLNNEASDLEPKLTRAGISESIRYACRHWANHLRFASPRDPELRVSVQDFCERALLPWLEVMSLLGHYNETLYLVRHAENWARASDPSSTAATLLQDLHHFIIQFKAPATMSAEAIYSVALPLAYPSQLHQRYHDENHSLRIYPDGPVNFWATTSRVISPYAGDHDVNAITISRDNKHILSGSKDGTAHLFTMNNGKCIATFEGHRDWVETVAFSPNGKTIVSGSDDGTIKVWDSNTYSLKFTLEGHHDFVLTVDISPDSSYIVSGAKDTTIRLWDATTGSHIATMEGHSAWVQSVMFSPDGQKILSASQDTTIRIWNAEDQSLLTELGHSSDVRSAVFSSDGNLIGSGGDDGTVKIWDVESYSLIRTFGGCSEGISNLAFSPDSKFMVTSSGDCTIRVWDILDGSIQAILEGHTSWIPTVAFTPDQRFIVSGSNDTTVRIWNWKDVDGYPGKSPVIHSSSVTAIAFSSNGKIMASGGDDGEMRLWDIADMAHAVKLEGRSDWMKSIYFSPDSRYVTAFSWKQTTCWDLSTHQIVSGPASSIAVDHSLPKQSIQHEVSRDTSVEYRLELESSMIYARRFGPGQEMRSKKLFSLPIPNISASGAHGYHLAVGTKGGRIIILDFSGVVSFEAMFLDDKVLK